jgi:hypothetical protein
MAPEVADDDAPQFDVAHLSDGVDRLATLKRFSVACPQLIEPDAF